jgi:acyl-CoA synthetase (AMP-forming)/AMP-acid ligase II
VVRDAFEHGDAWFVTGDVLRIDPDGDYWFVDRSHDLINTQRGPVSTVHVEDVLYELPVIARAAVYGMAAPDQEGELPVGAVVLREGDTLDLAALARHVERRLDGHARPRFLRILPEIPMSVGYRPLKQKLREEPLAGTQHQTLRYDQELKLYELFDGSPQPAGEPDNKPERADTPRPRKRRK